MRLGPVVPQGVLVGYGDYGTNTGPIDILAVSPTGVVTTLLAAFDTEEVNALRSLGGAVYIPAIDPKTNGSAQVATNYGGTWHTVTAQPPGVGVAVHLFDVALDGTDLVACGAREPDTAFVWRSTDFGVTWTEDLAHVADGNGFNRFYFFRRSAGRLVVTTTHGTPRYYVRIDGAWAPASGVGFDGPSDGVVLDQIGDRTLSLSNDGSVRDSTIGVIHHLTGPLNIWTGAIDPAGGYWLCDRTTIYRLS